MRLSIPSLPPGGPGVPCNPAPGVCIPDPLTLPPTLPSVPSSPGLTPNLQQSCPLPPFLSLGGPRFCSSTGNPPGSPGSRRSPSNPWPGAGRDVSPVRAGTSHVPGAGSCCWPQPFLFSWRSEKCSGVGGVVGHGVGDELTMRRLLCISGSAECICFGWGWGGVVWKSKGLRREDSWVPDNGRCRLQF